MSHYISKQINVSLNVESITVLQHSIFAFVFSYPTLDECEQNEASCYGAPTENATDKCCLTCTEVKTAYKNMEWKIAVHKISQCLGKFISRELVMVNDKYIGNNLCSKIT